VRWRGREETSALRDRVKKGHFVRITGGMRGGKGDVRSTKTGSPKKDGQ